MQRCVQRLNLRYSVCCLKPHGLEGRASVSPRGVENGVCLWAGTASCASRVGRGKCGFSRGRCVLQEPCIQFDGPPGRGSRGLPPCLPFPLDLGMEGVSKGRHLLFFLAIPQGVWGIRAPIRDETPALEAPRFHRWTTGKVPQLREGSESSHCQPVLVTQEKGCRVRLSAPLALFVLLCSEWERVSPVVSAVD